MKLLKYVMTHDSGLAPNPYSGICSLAVCTPNHRNAKLDVGDWVIGHSTKATGHRLIYAMRLSKVLRLQDYFEKFPQKRPDPNGSIEEQHGDNFYYKDGDRWARLPSAEHNDPESFLQDAGSENRKAYLAEGEYNYWYFGGASQFTESINFPSMFPRLIQETHGFSYVRDENEINRFVAALSTMGKTGLLGVPRDQITRSPEKYLIAIHPSEEWKDAQEKAKNALPARPEKTSCKRC